MVICKKCFVPMMGHMFFQKKKHEKYWKCPECKRETKHLKIRDFNLDYKEVLRNTYKENS